MVRDMITLATKIDRRIKFKRRGAISVVIPPIDAQNGRDISMPHYVRSQSNFYSSDFAEELNKVQTKPML